MPLGLFIIPMYQLKYYSKTIEITYDAKKEEVCLIAHLSLNKITKQKGYILYLASNAEKWDPMNGLLLINALFFKTPEEAFVVAEEILNTNPQVINELRKLKV